MLHLITFKLQQTLYNLNTHGELKIVRVIESSSNRKFLYFCNFLHIWPIQNDSMYWQSTLFGENSLSIGQLIGTFSLRKIRCHLYTALLSSSYSSGFTLFEMRPLFYFSKILSLFFSHVDKVIFWHSEQGSNILMGSSNSLSVLYFILYDLFSARRFVATNAIIVKFQNVNKQCV